MTQASAYLLELENSLIELSWRLRVSVPVLRLKRGVIGVVIGPNGSGKSTLGRYICRIKGEEKVESKRDLRPEPAAVMVWLL